MAENVCVELIAFVTDDGAIASATLIVTVAFAVADNESVTRTTVVPAVAGAVNNPDVPLMLPPPETIEYTNGPVPPVAENICVLFTANVFAAGFIPNAFVTVTFESDT